MRDPGALTVLNRPLVEPQPCSPAPRLASVKARHRSALGFGRENVACVAAKACIDRR